MKSPRYLAVAVAGLLTAASLAACSGGDSASDAETITIVVAAPLTGDSAQSGKDMVNGAELAATYLNEQGGVQSGELKGKTFRIVAVDDQLSTSVATTIAADYASNDEQFALTGFNASGLAQAAGVVLNRSKLCAVVSFAAADFLTDDADNLALVSPSVRAMGRVAVNVAVTLGAKKVATIAGDYSFLDSYYKGIDAQVDDSSLESVGRQTYSEGTADFSTVLTSIEQEDPDVILSGAFQADAGKIIAQARRMGLEQAVVDFLAEGWSQPFADAAGSALSEGKQYVIDGSDAYPPAGSLAETIEKLYQDTYGQPMPAGAKTTFDSVLTINAAIEAGATSKHDLLDYLPKAEGEGVLGPIGFDDDLRPGERYTSVSEVGPGGEHTKVARYLLVGDSRVERQD